MKAGPLAGQCPIKEVLLVIGSLGIYWDFSMTTLVEDFVEDHNHWNADPQETLKEFACPDLHCHVTEVTGMELS